MNIHFTDQKLKQQLDQATLVHVEFGSTLYGLNTSASDKDILCIYCQGQDNLHSCISYEHTLQFKDNNIDYIYVSLDQFIKSLLKGESTVYFEVLHTNEMKEKLNWLYNLKDYFYHADILTAYIGLAKRDLKQAKKEHVVFGCKKKKLSHCLRGLQAYDTILQKNYYNNVKDTQYAQGELLHQVKNTDYVNERNYLEIEAGIQTQVDMRMKQVNEIKHQYVLTINQLKEINQQLIQFCHSYQYLNIQKIDSDDIFINAMINGISY